MGAKYNRRTYICEHCGNEYKSSSVAVHKFCSRACIKAHTQNSYKRTCLNCGSEFIASSSSKGLYCCHHCYAVSLKGKKPHNYSGEPLERTCLACGKPFTIERGHTNKGIYCSPKCGASARSTNDKRTCIHCGIEFKVWSPRKDTAKFCSRKCQGEHYRGENNPCWKGGRFPYYGTNWNDQRKAARKRDGYRCQHCGITQKKLRKQLDVHHIIPRSQFNGDSQKANDLSNLITLCKSCHRKAETGKIPIQPVLV